MNGVQTALKIEPSRFLETSPNRMKRTIGEGYSIWTSNTKCNMLRSTIDGNYNIIASLLLELQRNQ